MSNLTEYFIISGKGDLVGCDITKHWEGATGKSLSEALLFAEHGENMLYTEIVLNQNNLIT